MPPIEKPPLPEGLVQAYIENRGPLFWEWLVDKRSFPEYIAEEFELGYAPKRAMFNIWPVDMVTVPRYPREIGESIYESRYKLPGKMGARRTMEEGASLAIPIRSAAGELKGFASRYIGIGRRSERHISGAKYKRYEKALPPYGAYQFLKTSRKAERAILVEGYSDVWRMKHAEIHETLSVYGTSGLSSFIKPSPYDDPTGASDFRSLVRNKDIWIFMDGDVAGRTAAVQMAAMIKQAKVKGTLEIGDIWVVVGPAKKDPDDLGKTEIQKLLAETPMSAEAYVNWWFRRGIDSSDPTQVRVLESYIKKIWPF